MDTPFHTCGTLPQAWGSLWLAYCSTHQAITMHASAGWETGSDTALVKYDDWSTGGPLLWSPSEAYAFYRQMMVSFTDLVGPFE